ncbi:NAD(P)/FAD-dependent oxidoreductase, partial [Bacteroidota bacterium]
MKVAVIGGGAAGFFAAIAVKENFPNAEVVILEKTQKLLAKVSVSGGGRCNLTNGVSSIGAFSKAYPRGSKQLKKAFQVFNNSHVIQWFETRGVSLYTQDDNRVFPTSNDSQTIIDCFLKEVKRLQIEIRKGEKIEAIKPLDEQL